MIFISKRLFELGAYNPKKGWDALWECELPRVYVSVITISNENAHEVKNQSSSWLIVNWKKQPKAFEDNQMAASVDHWFFAR